MPEPIAIALTDVKKIYRLYDNFADQAFDVLGLSSLRFWRRIRCREFPALNGINLEIRKGERIGIVGRNGAGKTTLLKLLTGNFEPTSGNVQVGGTVQALMSTGLGFHPEFTGYENARSALVYNGLDNEQAEEALADVIEFAELGQFLHQPIKVYSAGMSARLEFAVATAIKPDILIIDEVLGAGDAYFSGKSASRVEKLSRSGCTLLLVSHSTEQVLQFCEKAIWIERGKIVQKDTSLQVVKAYEEFIHKIRRYSPEAQSDGERQRLREHLLEQVIGTEGRDNTDIQAGPYKDTKNISRWDGERGLKIGSIRLLGQASREINWFKTGDRLRIEIEVVAEMTDNFSCRFVILLFTADGRPLTRHLSDQYQFRLEQGGKRKMELVYDKILLGNGEYIFSAAIYKRFDPENHQSAIAYDLLSRSFQFRVTGLYPEDRTICHLPGRWVWKTEKTGK